MRSQLDDSSKERRRLKVFEKEEKWKEMKKRRRQARQEAAPEVRVASAGGPVAAEGRSNVLA